MLNWFRRKARKASKGVNPLAAGDGIVFLPPFMADGSAPAAEDRQQDSPIDTDPGTPADSGSHDGSSGHSCGSHSCGGASCGGGGG